MAKRRAREHLVVMACMLLSAPDPSSADVPAAARSSAGNPAVFNSLAVPFSFSLGGAPADLSRWSTVHNATQRLDAIRTQATTAWLQPPSVAAAGARGVEQWTSGLRAQLERTDYVFGGYGGLGRVGREQTAHELLLRFRNDGVADSPALCDVSTLDHTWPLPASAAATLHTNGGSFARGLGRDRLAFDYAPGSAGVPLGANISLSPAEGMSSDGLMPWFALELPSTTPADGGGGAVLSLGWTGNWRLRVTRDAEGVRLRASVGDLCAVIHPGEALRVLRVLVVPLQGDAAAGAGALRAAINLHRRVLVDYKVPRKASDRTAFQGALTASWTWGGWPASDLHEAGQQQHIAWIKKIGADAWWLDAGWFDGAPGAYSARTGSFPSGIGNWRLPASASVNATKFPHGLGPLSAAARAKGLRSIVWFDIEGVFPGTTIWDNRSSLIFRNFSSGRLCELADQRSLLDLGNPATWQYLLNFSISAIEEYDIDVFRLDYNVGMRGEPTAMLPCWRAADPPGRSGMAEVRYVQVHMEIQPYWHRSLPFVSPDWPSSISER
jgi:alpha-galactosidase